MDEPIVESVEELSRWLRELVEIAELEERGEAEARYDPAWDVNEWEPA